MIIVIILAVLLIMLIASMSISNAMTTVAMADALKAQAQATQALAVTELLREVITLVVLLVVLAGLGLAIVAVWRRKPAKVVNIQPKQVIRGEVVERPQLPQGTPIEQLTQVMMVKLMADMMRDNEKEIRQ